MDISGKVAVVTGGASGIGQAVVKAFVAKGGKVVIFDLNDSAGEAFPKNSAPRRSMPR